MSLKKESFGSEIKRLASEQKRRRELRCFGMNEIDDERRQYYIKWKERRRLEEKYKRSKEELHWFEYQVGWHHRIIEIMDKFISEENKKKICRKVEMEKKGFEFRLDLENDERENTRALRSILGFDRYLEDGGYDEIERFVCPSTDENTEEEMENYINYGTLV
ncbi:Hypothetical predicted protein [Paramuricea clavata]|uniref:Uncharacterized protein n=1 Tax=Paramuricea clavata TaxID=317549 RepID=A0A7D9JGC2_PARCT|nr:Hypothetical predicted protein [Paramuricea clavata]